MILKSVTTVCFKGAVSMDCIDRPVFYSFRRCPYAMRARLAIAYAAVEVELREIVLRNKPVHMLSISPKGTVPVLQLENGHVIDESLNIMHWALSKCDPDNLLPDIHKESIQALIDENDNGFKQWLDRYKYADRYPEQSVEYYRDNCESWFKKLDDLLQAHSGFLVCSQLTLADLALLPFIRQCAHVDLEWFEGCKYQYLKKWLEQFKASTLFASIMPKIPTWNMEGEGVIFPFRESTKRQEQAVHHEQ